MKKDEIIIIESSSSEMNPDKEEEPLPLETVYESNNQSPKSTKSRSVRNKYASFGCVRHYKWLELNDETKLEKIQEFGNGGFGLVTLFKFKANGKYIIVKQNKKSTNSEADTINEIRQMSKVESQYTIRCYGYSLVDEANDDVAIVLEYGGELSPRPQILTNSWIFFLKPVSNRECKK